jgi:hypothetical protein
MNDNIKFIIASLLFFLLIVFSIFYFTNEGKECIEMPIQYGIKQLEKVNEDSITCKCQLDSIQQSPILYITKNNSWVERISEISEESTKVFNFKNFTLIVPTKNNISP